MWYMIEFFADYAARPNGQVYGDAHDVMEVFAMDLQEAEDRVGAELRLRFGNRWVISGAVGISSCCLHC